MTEQQYIHIAMLNSFNILVNNVSLEDLMNSDLPMLAHDPMGDISMYDLNNIISYFESIEMYEYCIKIKKTFKSVFINNNNNQTCECPHPVITRYTSSIRCERCRKKIVR